MLYSLGNKKIGKDTVIINLCSATTCPAKDMCLLRNECYAWSNERLRVAVKPYRDRQEVLWKSEPAQYYINYLKMLKSGFLKYIRFQESGDFSTQADVDKMSEIAEALKGDYVCYTYTARHDLDYSQTSDNLVITGSYFMVDNMFVPLKKRLYDEIPKQGTIVCAGDCRECTLCKVARGLVIYQCIH